MPLHTPGKQIPRKHLTRSFYLLLLLWLLLGILIMSRSASAAIPSVINFQGKVVNADGTNVANNTYPFTFRLYNTASPTTTTSCASEASCLWEESYASVQVTNGIFRVELGSSCPFFTANSCNDNAAIDFTTNSLYLTLKFNNDAQGYMSPTIHFTSTPYAFNSERLGGLTSSGFIQNGTSQQTSASFNIDGTGTAATLQASNFDTAASNAALGIGSTNAGAFTIGNITNSTFLFRAKSQAGAYQLQNAGGNTIFAIDTSATAANNQVLLGKAGTIDAKLVFYNAANSNTLTLISGATSTSYTLTAPTAGASGTQCLQSTSASTSTATALTFAGCGSGTLASTYTAGSSTADQTILLTAGDGGGVLIQDASSTVGTLFAVQKNAPSGQMYLGVTSSAITMQDTAGNNALVFDSTTSELRVYENVASPSNYARIFYASNEAVFAASAGVTRIGSGSGDITFSTTNADDVITYTHSGSLSANINSTFSDFKITRNLAQGSNTSTGSSVLKVEDASSANAAANIAPDVLLVVQGNGSAGGNLLNATSGGTSRFSVSNAGQLTIEDGITVGSASGISANCSAGQYVDDATIAGGVITAGSCVTSDLQAAYNADTSGDADIVTASGSGDVLIKAGSSADSQTLFRVQSSGSVDIFKVDTETATDVLEVQVGDSTDDSSFITLGLDVESTFSEASSCVAAIYGSVYYNGTTNAIRACVNGAWEDLVSTAGLGLQLFGVVPDTGPSGEQGDLGSLVSTGVSGPCKVSWASATTVNIKACTAYSGGRKIVYAGTSGLTISLTNTIDWVHVCFDSSGGIQTLQSAGATDDSNLPTYSNTAPILCLADITNGGTGTSIVRIYDIRTFTTTIKEHVTINAATGLGRVVTQSATVGQVQNPAATLGLIGIRGVIVATSGSASSTTRNAIIASEGPQFIKAAGTSTVNQFAQTSGTTAGYTSSTATADADGYANIGLNQRTIDTACNATTNCQYSQLVNMSLR